MTARQPPASLRFAVNRTAAAVAWCVGLIGSAANVAAQSNAPTASAPVRGVVRPVNQAAFTTDLSARALSLPFKEGERFAKGDVLAAFDCRRQRAEVAAAEATLAEMRATLEGQLHLERHNAAARTDVEIARARAAKADAEAQGLRARIDQCDVVAPFDGRVVELGVRPYEIASPQRPFLVVLDDAQLEVEMIVASSALADLARGTVFVFVVDELKREFRVEVERIGAAVDPVSQTIKVIGRLDRAIGGVLAGMSGTLHRVGKDGRT